MERKVAEDFLQKCLAQAVFDVFGMMAGMETCHVTKNIDNCQPSSGDITGVMFIQGIRNAMLHLTLNKEHAAMIVSYMTGNSPLELLDDELYDGVAEMVNMIAGRAKALLAGTNNHYMITPPFTIVGLNHFIVYKKEVSKINMKFTAGETELYLGLTYL
ncbi:chemotaxis protein CheX [Pelosinus sp. sgz500959]|uniref:chemotaxis protein CheX n=1 Tax=Pelosinus sp. sgz500959 TaxID=3242472 RepID=UPI00366A5BBA